MPIILPGKQNTGYRDLALINSGINQLASSMIGLANIKETAAAKKEESAQLAKLADTVEQDAIQQVGGLSGLSDAFRGSISDTAPGSAMTAGNGATIQGPNVLGAANQQANLADIIRGSGGPTTDLQRDTAGKVLGNLTDVVSPAEIYRQEQQDKRALWRNNALMYRAEQSHQEKEATAVAATIAKGRKEQIAGFQADQARVEGDISDRRADMMRSMTQEEFDKEKLTDETLKNLYKEQFQVRHAINLQKLKWLTQDVVDLMGDVTDPQELADLHEVVLGQNKAELEEAHKILLAIQEQKNLDAMAARYPVAGLNTN